MSITFGASAIVLVYLLAICVAILIARAHAAASQNNYSIPAQVLAPAHADASTCYVCIYGAIGRAFPSAWEGVKTHIVDLLRGATQRVEVHVWEQVDGCFDQLKAPENCRELIEPYATSYTQIRSETIDDHVKQKCLSGGCCSLVGGEFNWTFTYRFAYMENLVSQFLKNCAGRAIAITGDIVVVAPINADALLNIPERSVGVLNKWEFDGIADGLYTGLTRDVSDAMSVYQHVDADCRDGNYERHLSRLFKKKSLTAVTVPLIFRKLRRNGTYAWAHGDFSSSYKRAFENEASRLLPLFENKKAPFSCARALSREDLAYPDEVRAYQSTRRLT